MSDSGEDETCAATAPLGMGWERVHRDLTSRLGFGDGVTEPMASNDTIVAWFEKQGRLANEWVEHELWRNDCHAVGHPGDKGRDEHGPTCCNRIHHSAVTRPEAKDEACRGWFADWDDAATTDYGWQPCLETGQGHIPCFEVWFKTKAECEEWIAANVIGVAWFPGEPTVEWGPDCPAHSAVTPPEVGGD